MNTSENAKQAVPKFMSARKFADHVGLPPRIVYDLIKTGELEYFKPGTRTIYVLVESYRGLAHSVPTE